MCMCVCVCVYKHISDICVKYAVSYNVKPSSLKVLLHLLLVNDDK